MKEQLELSLPSAIECIIATLISMVDTFAIAYLGSTAIAAVGAMASIINFLKHDNYGTDSHNQPFDGTINWNVVRKALTDINYNGELTSEVRYKQEELADSSNINKTYDLIERINKG